MHRANLRSRWFFAWCMVVVFATLLLARQETADGSESQNGVFVRLKLEEPKGTQYYVRLAGYIHIPNWYLPRAVLPTDADGNAQEMIRL